MRLVSMIAMLLAAPWSAAATWEEQRADLQFARDRHLPMSLAYAPEDRKRAVAFIDETLARGERLSDEGFLLALLRIQAFARNAHEGVHGGGWMPGSRLPFRMIWFPDAMVVARAAPEYHDLLGGRIENIEGLAPGAIAERLRPYFGGNDGYLRWNATWLVELGGLLHAMGAAREPDRLRIRVRKRDGSVVERAIAFVPRAAAAAGASPPRLWAVAAYASEKERGWKSAIDGREPPLYLREPDEPFRIASLPALRAMYVQFRANSTADAGGRDIAAFVRQVRQALAHAKPQHLVLDLRFDIGGDIDQTRELARDMAALVPGRLFVLTGPYTFSAGIVFAAAVKREAGKRASLVGEAVGDRLRFWSEGTHNCLPHSRYCLQASNGLWDLRKGCAGEEACYGDRYEAHVDSLEPDLRAALTSGDWLSGRDAAMEAVAAAPTGPRAP